MASRTATLRLQLLDAVSGPAKGVSSSLSGIDGSLSRLGKGGAPRVKALAKQLEYLQKKSGAIDTFTSSSRGLKEMGIELKQARSNVTRLQQALATATKPTAKMKADLDSAKAALRSAVQTFRQQVEASRNAERALRSFGVNGRNAIAGSQKGIRDEIAKTIREMRRLDQEARRPKPPKQPPVPRQPGMGSAAGEAMAAIGGGAVANQGRKIAQRSFLLGVDFNQAAEYQAALGDFKGGDRTALNRQAEKIGGDTRFSNVDVVRAQTTILQRGIRDVQQIMDLTQKVTDYSLAMGVTLEEGAEAVTGSALSKRIDLKDTKAIGNFVDFMVWMAKNGGMSNEDVSQFIKYGGAPTTGARLSDETMAAMGMILRRSGVRGDEAGVFARSAASKLVAPTQKGRDALAAMGVDFSKFTNIDSMNEAGIDIMMKQKFGVRLTAAMREQVRELIQNGEFMDPETGESRSVISDTGEFTSQMSSILGPLFGKKMSTLDAKALSKALADYQKYSIDSVDTMGLMNAIAASNPGIGNLNAFFTDKQGGRANMIFSQWAEFQRLLGMMQNVPGGVANKIGTEANQGIYGDWTKLTGTIETALTRIGQDWEFATRPLINKTNEIVDGFIGLSDSSRRLIEAFGAAVGILSGGLAIRAGGSLLSRMLGGGGGAAAVAATGGAAGGASLLGRAGGLFGKIGLPALIAGTLGRGSIIDDPDMIAKLKKSMEERKATAASQATRDATADSIRGDMGSITASWPIQAQMAMGRYIAVLTQGGAQAEAEAQQLGESIKERLSITAHPDVDTGQLERALGLARQLSAVLTGSGGGGPTPSGDPPNNLKFGGPRRRGGRVNKGEAYLVGEERAEMFVPNQNGSIIPQAGSGGGTVVNMPITINMHGNAGRSDAEELAKVLDQKLSRSAQIAFAGIRYGDA